MPSAWACKMESEHGGVRERGRTLEGVARSPDEAAQSSSLDVLNRIDDCALVEVRRGEDDDVAVGRPSLVDGRSWYRHPREQRGWIRGNGELTSGLTKSCCSSRWTSGESSEQPASSNRARLVSPFDHPPPRLGAFPFPSSVRRASFRRAEDGGLTALDPTACPESPSPPAWPR